jgi:hypothetical protein
MAGEAPRWRSRRDPHRPALLKPDDVGIAAAMRVLPDTIALLSRLARDRSLPLSTRAPIWALAGYLASVSARECLLSAERGR